MSNDSNHNATQIDPGWRSYKNSDYREGQSGSGAVKRIPREEARPQSSAPATQMDPGWRGQSEPAPATPATQMDPGWRGKSEPAPAAPATQMDPGWRGQSEPASAAPATQMDPGWRGESRPAGQATQVDTGWRQNVDEMLGADGNGAAVPNHFKDINSFKDAVEKLTELKSSKGNMYAVKETISRKGGEAVVLLCAAPDGRDVAVKVYYEPANGGVASISSRSHVLEYMASEEGRRYTLAVEEIGLVTFGASKYYFEVMPYCPNADLADDGAMSFDRLVEITRQMNEALRSIHRAGIIHRDIKPDNLFEVDGVIKLGDFGVAKDAVAGRSNMTEHIVGTEGYAAPETRRYIVHEKSDYYSLGVTLASLFEGHFVFENMDFNKQSLLQESERLPLKRLDERREQLENLLNGLCRIDAKKRFGYEDVARWLANHNYAGGAADEEWPKSFRLLADAYHDEESMFRGITADEKHWNEAKEMLYKKYIEQFFMSFRTDLARAAQIADDMHRGGNRDKGLTVFLKTLYAPGPIVWKGYTFNSLSELGGRMAATSNPAGYSELLQNRVISHWLSNTEGITCDAETLELVNAMESLSAKEPSLAVYWFGFSFAPKKELHICGKAVSTVKELLEALLSSPAVFYQNGGYQKLLSRVDGADLYGFLFSFGFRQAIDKQWENLNKCDLYHKSALLFAMLDNIASKANVDPAPVRNFFLNYGPLGPAVYTQKLIADKSSKVYTPLDADGKQALARVSGFKEPECTTVDDMFRAYQPLVEHVDKLRRILVENPYCILTGVYTSSGVICTDLVGCFGFKIFDRPAPLGFLALLEAGKGGK